MQDIKITYLRDMRHTQSARHNGDDCIDEASA